MSVWLSKRTSSPPIGVKLYNYETMKSQLIIIRYVLFDRTGNYTDNTAGKVSYLLAKDLFIQ